MLHQARRLLARVRELFRNRSQFDYDQSDEFAFHVDMETAENIRRGMNETDARRAATLRFGGAQRFREETNDARGIVAFDNLARDARFAFRRLHRAPAFSAGVVATLGIGIGAAAGIGSIVYGVLLRDLPFDKPEQLMRVGFHTDGVASQGDLHSPVTYYHFAKSARSFTELGAYSTSDDFNVTDGNAPERVSIAMLTPNTLTLLRAQPLLGQLFETADSSWSNPRSAIILSENFWRRRYGADPSIIGRRIEINRGARNVIGILPRSFDFPTASVDLYYPAPVPIGTHQITARGLNVIGRLREGVDATRAQAELRTLLPTLSSRFPDITSEMLKQSGARVSVQSLKATIVAPVHSQLVLLGVLVAVVLLVAITNVVNLFLLRAERASQEIAIALSLGASRLALVQRFAIEGITLGLASTTIAIPSAALALTTKFGFTEREIPRLSEVAFTAHTAALVVGGAMFIGAAVGLISLTRVGINGLFDRLRAARSTTSRGWRRAQNGLVALQVAMALVLLVAAGLLGRSFWNLRTANVGFAAENAMTFQLSLPWGEDGYVSYARSAAFHARMAARLRALPGVEAVAVALRVPLAGRGPSSLSLDLQAGDDEQRPSVAASGNMATAGYFHTMGIPFHAGRPFQPGDLHGTPAVIISERLAKNVFGSVDVIGRTVKQSRSGRPPVSFTIVGVVGDVHLERIEDGYSPTLYFPLLRDSDGLPPDSSAVPGRAMDVQYAIRGTHLPAASTIQRIAKELDPRVPASNIRTLASLVDDATARVRLTMLLIAIAGAAALVLGVIGVYTVVAYAATGRVKEFGIRIALGAAPSRVGKMVLGDGMKLVAAGTATGLLIAVGATRFLSALLYEVAPTSAAEFGAATLLVILVTLLATVIPARRAARTHPGVVLRGE